MKKGITNIMMVVLLLIVALVAAAGVYLWTGGAQPAQTYPPTMITEDYDGEFTDYGVPSDVSGTDLREETAYAESNDAWTATFNMTQDMNQTASAINGNTWLLAGTFDINDDVEELQIDGAIDSSRTTDCETKKVYIVPDEDGNSLYIDDAVITCEVDDDQDDFECEKAPLEGGEYVLVIEMRTVSISGSIDGNTLYTVDFDIDTEGDVDEGTLTIEA